MPNGTPFRDTRRGCRAQRVVRATARRLRRAGSDGHFATIATSEPSLLDSALDSGVSRGEIRDVGRNVAPLVHMRKPFIEKTWNPPNP
jgi:hypothetical protein